MNEIQMLVKQLCERYAALQAENRQLKAELTETRESLADAQNQIDALNTKYDRLKLAKAYGWNSDERNKAVAHINKLVREIESCLSLMRKMN